jgi:NAD-dependent dihydropyrimidine dehydrogenase PreA subunit
MAYVITDICVSDRVCIEWCPSNAIHPQYEDTDFGKTTQLFINPLECMDCGSCARACPTNAIFSGRDLPNEKSDALRLNYIHFFPD